MPSDRKKKEATKPRVAAQSPVKSKKKSSTKPSAVKLKAGKNVTLAPAPKPLSRQAQDEARIKDAGSTLLSNVE